MDCGVDGFKDTLRYATENDVLTVGAGYNKEQASKPLILEKDGVKVGILSVMYRWSVIATETTAGCLCIEDYQTIKKQIRLIKSECDYCVVIAHGGEEFVSIPLPFVRNHCKRYLKWGADVVVGHHPHVPQNYETFSKIKFDKKGFSWDNLCTKVDRDNNRVIKNDPIVIFRDIQRKDYRRLLPLAEQDFSRNLFNKNNFVKEYHKTKSKKAFVKSKMRRFRKRERFGIIKAVLKRPLNRWKKVSPDKVDYIGGDLINTNKN